MADTSNLLYAPISNGQSTYEASMVDKQTGKIKSDEVSDTAGGKLDKEAFLQLLVAQMQYQDPLEPTDNTEYVSQLANFSSLEQMQNMSSSLSNMSLASDMQRAAGMVGEYATVTENGVDITTGKVDSVEYKDGTVYVSINDKSYELSKVSQQIDKTYLSANLIAKQFTESMNEFPMIEAFTLSHEDMVTTMRTVYDNLDAYQKQFISSSDLDKLAAYETRLAELKAEAAEADQSAEAEESTETEEAAEVTETIE